MRQPNFFSNPNLRRLGIPAAAVIVLTSILSRGNFLAAIGAGIATAISIYVTNYRLITKVKSLEDKLKDLVTVFEPLKGELESTEEQSEPLKEELEDLKKTLRDF